MRFNDIVINPARGCGKTEFARKIREELENELDSKILIMKSHRSDYSRFMRPERLRGETIPVMHPLLSLVDSPVCSMIEDVLRKRIVDEIIAREDYLIKEAVFTSDDFKRAIERMEGMTSPRINIDFCIGDDFELKERSKKTNDIICSINGRAFFKGKEIGRF